MPRGDQKKIRKVGKRKKTPVVEMKMMNVNLRTAAPGHLPQDISDLDSN